MSDRFGQDHLHHRGDRPGRRPRGRGGPEAGPSRPGPGATHQRHAMARPVGRRADRRRPGRSRGPPRRRRRGRLGLQLRRQGGGLGHASRTSAGSTSRPSGSCSTPPATPGSSGSSMSARSASMRAATTTGPTRPMPPAANSLDAYTRSKTEAEALVLDYHRRRGLPAAIVRPGFIYGERDRTVLPKLLTNLRRGTFALLRLGRAAAQLHLRQEPGPRASSWRPRAPRPSARSST